MALLWTVVLAGKSHQMFVGMESTLQMATLWGGFVAYLGLTAAPSGTDTVPRRPLLLFSACLVLIAWARLDGALFSAGFFIWFLFHAWKNNEDNVRPFLINIWPAFAVVGIGAGIQLAFYLKSAGTIIPISGLIKAATPHDSAAEIFRSFASTLFPFGGLVFTHAIWFLLFGLAVFSLVLAHVIRKAVSATDPQSRRLCRFAAILGIGSVVFAAIICRHHNVFSRWYLAPVYLFYILGCAHFLHHALSGDGRRSTRQNALRLCVAMALYVSGVLGMANSYASDPLYLSRYRFAHELRRLTEPGTTLAAFNAGQLAYFSDRRLINLDGLVNDRHYMAAILNKPSELESYLRTNAVDYLTDYDFYWANAVVGRMSDIVASAPTNNPEGDILTVRRVRAD
jgi:hypothetical protein